MWTAVIGCKPSILYMVYRVPNIRNRPCEALVRFDRSRGEVRTERLFGVVLLVRVTPGSHRFGTALGRYAPVTAHASTDCLSGAGLRPLNKGTFWVVAGL